MPIGAGLALTYAYGTARYRRNARTGYEFDDPPAPGTPAFPRLIEAATDLLCQAPARGVDVKILTNGPNTDKEVVRETGQRQYGRLLEAGVRTFEYQPTMLHAKVMIADGWANIGSGNLEHRSLGLDDELIVAFSDAGLVEELVRQFHDDLAVSEEFDLDRWRRRSLAKRAKEAAGDLFRQSF